MQGFLNDKNGFIIEYLFSCLALAHLVFKITFQSVCLRDFLAAIWVLSNGLLCVFFCGVFLKIVRLLVCKEFWVKEFSYKLIGL